MRYRSTFVVLLVLLSQLLVITHLTFVFMVKKLRTKVAFKSKKVDLPYLTQGLKYCGSETGLYGF